MPAQSKNLFSLAPSGVMVARVIPVAKQLQIDLRVIERVAVYVMNMLGACQFSTKKTLYFNSMFVLPAPTVFRLDQAVDQSFSRYVNACASNRLNAWMICLQRRTDALFASFWIAKLIPALRTTFRVVKGFAVAATGGFNWRTANFAWLAIQLPHAGHYARRKEKSSAC